MATPGEQGRYKGNTDSFGVSQFSLGGVRVPSKNKTAGLALKVVKERLILGVPFRMGEVGVSF